MRNRAYEEMKRHLIRAAKARKKPLCVHFELTARCNLDCKMCYVHTQDNAVALKKELSTEQWKQIFDEAYDNEMLYASLSGGECLVRKDFRELYLHLWNKKVQVSVLTNGTLLNEEYIEFFKNYRPEMIRISLYGSNEEGYLSVTGHKGFEKAISAVTALMAAGIDVRIALTPNKYMQDDYIELLKLCREKGLPAIKNDIMLLSNRDDATKNDYYLSADEVFDLSKRREELNNTLIPVEITPEPCGDMSKPPKRGLSCNAGNCLAVVTWDGKMYACINAMLGGAEVLQVGFTEAWQQTVAAAEQVVYGAECVGCTYDKTCPKCPGFRLKDLHSGHCNPAVCEMTRRLVAAGVKKLEQVEKPCD